MPFNYVVHKELHLIVGTGRDRPSWSEIKRCQEQARTDPGFSPQFDLIVDMRAVTGFDMTTEHVRTLANRMIFSFGSKRAFVASSPAVFGMGRMWQTFAELSDRPSQVRVFYDLPSALQWLGLNELPASIRPEPEFVPLIMDDEKAS